VTNCQFVPCSKNMASTLEFGRIGLLALAMAPGCAGAKVVAYRASYSGPTGEETRTCVDHVEFLRLEMRELKSCVGVVESSRPCENDDDSDICVEKKEATQSGGKPLLLAALVLVAGFAIGGSSADWGN
jgi:hypothetical protein